MNEFAKQFKKRLIIANHATNDEIRQIVANNTKKKEKIENKVEKRIIKLQPAHTYKQINKV